MSESELKSFQKIVRDYYAAHGRHDMPWRIPEPTGNFDPYKIMVSELMLQQTQVARVIPKFMAFLGQFPDAETLAQARLGEVLTAWSGLGYNRRAKYLHQAAQTIQREFDGVFPSSLDDLMRLPGVGKNTAGAIVAYAYNQPVVFVETNIRTVYIHHFFHDQIDIADTTIIKIIESTLDRQNPRAFYWALMDYGAYLKQTVGNLNKLSRNYVKQSTFQGSLRQIRGQVIRLLTVEPRSTGALAQAIDDDRLSIVLEDLIREGLIVQADEQYRLA